MEANCFPARANNAGKIQVEGGAGVAIHYPPVPRGAEEKVTPNSGPNFHKLSYKGICSDFMVLLSWRLVTYPKRKFILDKYPLGIICEKH